MWGGGVRSELSSLVVSVRSDLSESRGKYSTLIVWSVRASGKTKCHSS